MQQSPNPATPKSKGNTPLAISKIFKKKAPRFQKNHPTILHNITRHHDGGQQQKACPLMADRLHTLSSSSSISARSSSTIFCAGTGRPFAHSAAVAAATTALATAASSL